MDVKAGGSATGRWERKKQQTRAALMDAALRLVDERGLDHVTVEDISTAADVSPRTFFNYFSSKEEALTWRDPEAGERVRRRLLEAPEELGVLAALHQVMADEVPLLEAERDSWFLRFAVMERNPSLATRALLGGVAEQRALAAAIATRMGVDVDADLYPRLAAAVVNAALWTAFERWARSRGGRSMRELTDEALHLVAAGLPSPDHTRRVPATRP